MEYILWNLLIINFLWFNHLNLYIDCRSTTSKLADTSSFRNWHVFYTTAGYSFLKVQSYIWQSRKSENIDFQWDNFHTKLPNLNYLNLDGLCVYVKKSKIPSFYSDSVMNFISMKSELTFRNIKRDDNLCKSRFRKECRVCIINVDLARYYICDLILLKRKEYQHHFTSVHK